MKIKRCVFAYLMTAFMLLSNGAVYAQEHTLPQEVQTEITVATEELNVANKLSAIGIIDSVDKEEMLRVPTREDCAELMVRFINVPVSAATYTESPFFDVSTSRKSAASIITLYNMGYVSRGDDLKFYPERQLTANEAVTFIVKAMGYGAMAERLGGYPIGYFAIADRYGVTDNVTLVGSEPVLMKDMYMMLADALDAPAYSYVGTWGEYDEYSFDENHTILTENHKIKKIKGIVTSNDITSLTSVDSSLGDNEIKIDNIVYIYEATTDVQLGKSVVAYATLDAEYKDSIIYVEEDAKKNIVTKLDHSVLVASETTDTKLAYENSDKVKYLDLETNFKVIYNGKSRTNYYALSAILPAYGCVEAIDNDKNGAVDVLVIENYKTVIVSHVDTYENAIYDTDDVTKKIDFDGDVSISVADAETGEKMSPSMLTRGMVLSVASSDDKSVVKCLISNTTVSGRIEAVAHRDGETIYTINGTEYTAVADRAELNISLGTQGIFVLDAFGAIAAYGIDTSADDGYLYGVISGTEVKTGLDKTLELRMFETSGNFAVYPVRKKVKIDGTTKDVENASVRTEITNQAGNLIRYRVVNGEIAELDFATVVDRAAGESATESFGTLTQISETERFERRNNIFSPEAGYSFYANSAQVQVLLVPNDLRDTEYYGVYKASQMFTNNYVYSSASTGGSYNRVVSGLKVKCYNLGMDDNAADTASIFLMRADEYVLNSSTAHFVVASEITSVYNDDLDHETHRVYFNGTSEYMDIAERFTSHNYPGIQSFTEINLKPGDLFTYSTDGKGRIAYIRVWYRPNPDPGDKTNLTDSAPLYGSVFDGENVRGIARITGLDTVNKVISYETVDGLKKWSMTYTTPQVWLVRENAAGNITVSAISAGNLMVGDYIVFRSNSATCQDIVVYR